MPGDMRSETGSWGIPGVWEGEKGGEEARRQLLEEELNPGTEILVCRPSSSTGEWLRPRDLDKHPQDWLSKAAKLRDKFELSLRINMSTIRPGN